MARAAGRMRMIRMAAADAELPGLRTFVRSGGAPPSGATFLPSTSARDERRRLAARGTIGPLVLGPLWFAISRRSADELRAWWLLIGLLFVVALVINGRRWLHLRRSRQDPPTFGVFVTPDALLVADDSPWVRRVPRSAVLAVDTEAGTITSSTRLRARVPMSFWRGSPWSNIADVDAPVAVLDPLLDAWLADRAVHPAEAAPTA